MRLSSFASLAGLCLALALSAPRGAAVHFGRGALGRRGGVVRGVDLVGTDADGKAWLLWQNECGAQRRESQQ